MHFLCISAVTIVKMNVCRPSVTRAFALFCIALVGALQASMQSPNGVVPTFYEPPGTQPHLSKPRATLETCALIVEFWASSFRNKNSREHHSILF